MKTIVQTSQRLWTCQSGAMAVEFAFVGLILIVFSFGIVEFGRGLYLYNKISYAMDLMARTALTKPKLSDQDLKGEALAAFTTEKTSPVVTIGPKLTDSVTKVDYKIITISFPLQLLIPGVSNNSINITTSRRIPVLPAIP